MRSQFLPYPRPHPDKTLTQQSNFSLLQLQLNFSLNFTLNSKKNIDQKDNSGTELPMQRISEHQNKQTYHIYMETQRLTFDRLCTSPLEYNLTGLYHLPLLMIHCCLKTGVICFQIDHQHLTGIICLYVTQLYGNIPSNVKTDSYPCSFKLPGFFLVQNLWIQVGTAGTEM